MIRKRNIGKFKVLLLLLLIVTVGYALLSTTLKINGTVNIKKGVWKIHWDKNSINVIEGSVNGSTDVDSTEKNLVYTANLKEPGDYYEFTVDAVNEGTVDGMISLADFTPIVKDENNQPRNLPSYLKYSLKYADGTNIEKNHKIAKKTGNTPTREKYRIVIEFDKDVEEEDLPEIPETITIESSVPFNQANDEARDREKKTLHTYTITFDAQGGIASSSTKEVEEEGRYGSLPSATKDGYTFLGWYLNDTKITSKDRVTITQNVTLEARYSAHTFTITYNLDGGTNSRNNPSEYTPDTETITLSDPTKTGYTFLGWITEGVLVPTKSIQIPKGTIGNKEYIAVWCEDKKIIYNSNGGEFTDSKLENKVTYKYDTTTSGYIGDIAYLEPTRSAYRFIGWNTKPNGTGTSYVQEANVIGDMDNISTNTVLYAQWEELTAMFDTGPNVNIKMKKLAGNSGSVFPENDSNVISIVKSSVAPEISNMTSDNIVSVVNSELPIYAWFDNGTIYWWCESEKAYLNSNSRGMFSSFSRLVNIDLSGFDASTAINMSSMFQSCTDLPDIDFSSLDTSNVTNMSAMFNYCLGLVNPDLSNFNTSSVTDMSSMFSWCTNMKTLNLSSWDTTNVETMKSMFISCKNLERLDLSGFENGKTTSMHTMFRYCNKLTELNLNNFNTNKVTDMGLMFAECDSLATLDLSSFDVSCVEDMQYMFSWCINLKELDISSFNPVNVENIRYIFSNCEVLESLDLSNWTTLNLTNMDGMFNGCKALKELDLSDFNTNNVLYMDSMFSGCNSLTELDLSSFNTSNVTGMNSMFSSCSSLTELDLSKFNTSNVTDMNSMFNNCSSLTSLDLSGFDIDDVEKIDSIFYNCTSIETIDISNWNFSSITSKSLKRLFYDLSSLKTIVADNINTSSIESMKEMFYGCSKLINVDLSDFNTSSVTDMSSMFCNCHNLGTIDLSSFNTSNVKNMSLMFCNCYNVITLDLSNFNTGQLTNMQGLFSNCRSLVNLNVNSFDLTNIKYLGNVFSGCSSLVTLDLSSWDTSGITDMSNLFYNCTNLTTIYVSNSFVTNNVTSSNNMFYGMSTNLVGGNGTVWSNSNPKDKTYACIDTVDTPGYFTYKAPTINNTGIGNVVSGIANVMNDSIKKSVII